MPEKIVFTFKDVAKEELDARSKKLVRDGAPFKLAGVNLSVHFLRGVFSRASLCLPAYYYLLGSTSAHEVAKRSSDYPFKVAQSYSEFSDLNTLTLSCRKLFDHSKKPDLTGGNFSKLSDEILRAHASYWAKHSPRSENDAFVALKFLRRFFSECSQTDTSLLRAQSQLQKRIGALKQHADRAAAHLSLEDYSLSIIDLTHFTAACVVVAEIIRSFDIPTMGPGYFQGLDAASYQAAKRIFSQIPRFQLFAGWNLENQARLYWEWGEDFGIHMLLNQIQHTLGGEPKDGEWAKPS